MVNQIFYTQLNIQSFIPHTYDLLLHSDIIVPSSAVLNIDLILGMVYLYRRTTTVSDHNAKQPNLPQRADFSIYFCILLYNTLQATNLVSSTSWKSLETWISLIPVYREEIIIAIFFNKTSNFTEIASMRSNGQNSLQVKSTNVSKVCQVTAVVYFVNTLYST